MTGFPAEEDVETLRENVLRWYDGCRRDLPWRHARDPYQIWVAEVMLQQTRVEVVESAYRRFLQAFPAQEDLAAAGEEDVLAVWSGLGYYSRARSLHRAARLLSERGDRFPETMKEALDLPGVGPYTASAILSIAYGRPYACVDGNIVRVLCRLALLPRPDGRGEPHRALAAALLDRGRPGDWNQALMELGQLVCRPRAPLCGFCPLASSCAARAADTVDRYPPRTPRRRPERVPLAFLVIHDRKDRIILERGVFPYLDHLWLPVLLPEHRTRGKQAPRGLFRHAIVHRVFDVRVFEKRVGTREILRWAGRGAGERRIFHPGEINGIGRSSLLDKSLRVIGGDAPPLPTCKQTFVSLWS